MKKSYCDTPDNFCDIEPYVITKPKQIAKEILMASRCYFYDSCSLRMHMMISDPVPVFEYIKSTAGIVVITRCVLAELCSSDNKLWEEHIEYIRKMNEASIKVLVIYEEDIFTVMSMCFSGTARINMFLTFAVRTVKNSISTITHTLEDDKLLQRKILSGKECDDGRLYSQFFGAVRSRKESGDNLGEELIAICIHMLSNIPDINGDKYAFLTEDKEAIGMMNSMSHNLEKHLGKRTMFSVTSAKLVWLMLKDNIIKTTEQAEAIMKAGNTGDTIVVLCSEKFEMAPQFKSMSCRELAGKMTSSDGIHIYY